MDDDKIKTVKSKCMADMLVWLGFEYKKTNDEYVFKRDWNFDHAWDDMHELRQKYYKNDK